MRASVAGLLGGFAVSLRNFGSGRCAGPRRVASNTRAETAISVINPASASDRRRLKDTPCARPAEAAPTSGLVSDSKPAAGSGNAGSAGDTDRDSSAQKKKEE